MYSIPSLVIGFGELFARNFVGVRLGWGNPFRAPSATQPGGQANTSSVGLRAAGNHPLAGSAGARTAVEAVEIEALEVARQ